MSRSLLRTKLWAKGPTPSVSSGSGTVTSVAVAYSALSPTAAFTISGSPITTSGTITITANGNSSQYVTGAGNLASFPAVPSAADIIELEEKINTSTFASPGVLGESTYSAGTTVFNYLTFW